MKVDTVSIDIHSSKYLDIVQRIFERIQEQIPKELRGSLELHSIEKHLYDEIYECKYQVYDGSEPKSESIKVIDPHISNFFRIDANIVKAVLGAFRRGNELKPKADLFTFLGLWSLAGKQPQHQKDRIPIDENTEGLQIAFRKSDLMREMHFSREKMRTRCPMGEYSQKNWQDVKLSLERLSSKDFYIPYSKKGEREAFIYEGCFITLNESDQRETNVTLNVSSGIASNYYILISRRIFALQEELGEQDLRILLWLLLKHRGSTRGNSTKHNSGIYYTFKDLVGSDGLELNRGCSKDIRKRLIGSFERLVKLDICEKLETTDTSFNLKLSDSFFHVGDKDA